MSIGESANFTYKIWKGSNYLEYFKEVERRHSSIGVGVLFDSYYLFNYEAM
jgi:hypothetical protein